jgi:hypothetical protein
MPKQVVLEDRNDFRGGLNVYLSPDLLAANELTQAANCRVDTDGPIAKRQGSRRLHQTALNAATAIKGAYQWDGPSGLQIVAICNGDLFYRNVASGEYAAFTQVDPGVTDAFSTTALAMFSTLRGTESGAPLRLYIASGGKLYEWTGTTLSRLDGVLSATGEFAPDAELLATYHLRIFTNSQVRPQHLVWSKLGNGRVYKGGFGSDGGTAMMSSVRSQNLTNLRTLGRSLMVFTKESVSRVAGYSAADIQIDQDTEGVSPDVGCVGPLAAESAEHLVFFMSKQGMYAASEGAVSPIGLKVQPIFDAMDRTLLANITLGLHRGRQELWVAYAGASDASLNKSVMVFNLRHQAWYGPFTFPFGITALFSYEDANGDEFIAAGCSDGFMRHLDTGVKDDVLYDASGGSTYSMTADLAPFHHGDLTTYHAVDSMFVRLAGVVNAAPVISLKTQEYDPTGYVAFSIAFGTTELKTIALRGDSRLVGRRIYVRLTETAAVAPVKFHGVGLRSFIMNRAPIA